MLKADALSMAVDSLICVQDMHHEMMHEILGPDPDACKGPGNENLRVAILRLVDSASKAVYDLSPRSRDARLNLIWKDFVAEQKRLLNEAPKPTENGSNPENTTTA